MSIEVKSTHITSADGNVYIDLGFDPEVAAELQAASQQIISEKLGAEDKYPRMTCRSLDSKKKT